MAERFSCETAFEAYLRAVQGQAAALRVDLLKILEQRLWLGRLRCNGLA